ncbi:MAG: hypothetical protein AAF466_09900 [Bacteroidota bacterium]
MKKLTLLLTILFVSTTVFAQDAFTKDLFSADNIMKYQSEIDLTKAQKKKIKELYNEGNAAFTSAKWDLSEEKEKLDKMLEASQVDLNATLAQMREVTQLEQELKISRLGTLIKIKNELTPDQQTELKSLVTEKDTKPFFVTTDINDEKKIKLQVSGSKFSKAKPLYVILGKRGNRTISSAEMEEIDPRKIESISVLKDNSAIRLYGVKGKNGVIEIKLKEEK